MASPDSPTVSDANDPTSLSDVKIAPVTYGASWQLDPFLPIHNALRSELEALRVISGALKVPTFQLTPQDIQELNGWMETFAEFVQRCVHHQNKVLLPWVFDAKMGKDESLERIRKDILGVQRELTESVKKLVELGKDVEIKNHQPCQAEHQQHQHNSNISHSDHNNNEEDDEQGVFPEQSSTLAGRHGLDELIVAIDDAVAMFLDFLDNSESHIVQAVNANFTPEYMKVVDNQLYYDVVHAKEDPQHVALLTRWMQGKGEMQDWLKKHVKHPEKVSFAIQEHESVPILLREKSQGRNLGRNASSINKSTSERNNRSGHGQYAVGTPQDDHPDGTGALARVPSWKKAGSFLTGKRSSTKGTPTAAQGGEFSRGESFKAIFKRNNSSSKK